MNPDPASINRLHDIILPPPAPWWPPAPGWLLLLGFLILIALALSLRGVLHWQRNRYRREALAELSRLENAAGDASRRAAALTELSALLKRTALTAFARPRVASLTGPEWFVFLDRTGGTTFAAGPGMMLQEAVNDPRTAAMWSNENVSKIAELAKKWVRGHRSSASTPC